MLTHSSKKTYKKAIAESPYDALIITGYPFDGENWNLVIQMRMLWAAHMYKTGVTKHIIFSGSAVYTPYVEAKILAEYGKAMGIPDSVIFIEERAEHSVENVYYSYCIARDKGFKKIALATNWLQINQVRGFVRRHKIPIDYLPIQTTTLKTLDHTEPTIDCNKALKEPFVALTERQSFFKRFKGTLGYYVVWLDQDKK